MRAFITIMSIMIPISVMALWTKTTWPSDGNITCLATNGNVIAAGAMKNLFGVGGVYISTDGQTWTAKNSGVPDTVLSLFMKGNEMYAGTKAGVYYSSNLGDSWVAKNTGLPSNNPVYGFASIGATLFAGTKTGVYLSTDNGTNWVAKNTGIPTTATVNSLMPLGTNIFASVSQGVYLSTNNGTSWTSKLPSQWGSKYISCMSSVGTNLFAASLGAGVYESSDGAQTWSVAGLAMAEVASIVSTDTTTFAAAGTFGINRIYMTTKSDGSSWRTCDSGIATTIKTQALCLFGYDLYAGTATKGVWRKSLTEMIGVEKNPAAIIHKEELGVYPNPASQAAVILNPYNRATAISIYSATGSLVDHFIMAAGSNVSWPTAVIPPGRYVLRMDGKVSKFINILK